MFLYRVYYDCPQSGSEDSCNQSGNSCRGSAIERNLHLITHSCSDGFRNVVGMNVICKTAEVGRVYALSREDAPDTDGAKRDTVDRSTSARHRGVNIIDLGTAERMARIGHITSIRISHRAVKL